MRVCACAVSPVCGAVSGETYEHVGSGFDRGGADVRQERDRWEREQVRMHLGLVLYRHTTKTGELAGRCVVIRRGCSTHLEYVQAGASHDLGLEGLDQRLLVDDRTSRCSAVI